MSPDEQAALAEKHGGNYDTRPARSTRPVDEQVKRAEAGLKTKEKLTHKERDALLAEGALWHNPDRRRIVRIKTVTEDTVEVIRLNPETLEQLKENAVTNSGRLLFVRRHRPGAQLPTA